MGNKVNLTFSHFEMEQVSTEKKLIIKEWEMFANKK